MNDSEEFNEYSYRKEAQICNEIAKHIYQAGRETVSSYFRYKRSLLKDDWRIYHRIGTRLEKNSDRNNLKKNNKILAAALEIKEKLNLYDQEKSINKVAAGLLTYPSWAHPLEKEYRLFHIPKKNGGTRKIEAPSEWLYNLQKRIYEVVEPLVSPHPTCHGFTKNRSILTNAKPHCSKNIIYRFDIKKAFESSSQMQIIKCLKRDLRHLELSDYSLHFIAQIVSIKNHLPTGAPTSPFLLNRILHSFDKTMMNLAKRKYAAYTRYADDITISCESHIHIYKQIEKNLNKYGYLLNNEKTRVYRKGSRQIVTGLVCNHAPNIPSDKRRELRAAIHSWTTNGSAKINGKPVNLFEIKGHLNFLAMTNKALSEKLRVKLMVRGNQMPEPNTNN